MKRLELVDSAVMGQQSEEEGAQHTSLGAPVFSVMVLDCVLLPTCTAEVSRSESPTASCTERCEPQLDQFMNELLRDDCVESLWTAIWHTSLFLSRCVGLGGGQWWWHHQSSSWTYMQLEGVQEGGRTDLMCCMTSHSKPLHDDRSKCYWTVVIEAGWRWLLRDWNDGGSFEACGDNSLT